MYVYKSHKNFLAKRSGTKNTPSRKKTSKTTLSSGDAPENAI